jgi:CBS-domain-containing membrane protein
LRVGIRCYGLLVAAAITGTLVARVCPAEWIAAPLAVLITLALMNVADCRHAPALAVSLIPGIVHGLDARSLTAGVALGAGVLHLAGSAAIASPRMVEARWRVRLGRPAPARSPVADEV